ncbi:MAG: hypothetical protein HWN65_03335 [Candidatus Helarchaeota archaeon]|nr:hypothetical protein [Candidatus Helarchaeota archaeon]
MVKLQLPKNLIKWLKRGLLIIGLGLIAVGLLLSLYYNVILAPCTTKDFSLKTAPELSVFGEQIDFDCKLYEPLPEYNFYGTQRPALVLVHGILSSKLYFHGLSYEFSKRGFVCLTITANGHSASGGAFTPTWENVTLSAVKYLRESSSVLDIDINKIGLFGHSMGSFGATVASILDQELGNFWINATIGMGGPFLNITEGFGTGLAHILNNTMVYPDIWYDPQVAVDNAVIEGRTNLTRPYNYMNIIGSEDVAFSQDSAYELVYGMSTPGFWASQGVGDHTQIITSKTYGTFNGSARRLVVIPGVGHGLVGQDETTVIEAVGWFEQCMKLNETAEYPGALDPASVKIVGYSLSGMLAGLGGFIIFVPLIAYFGDWLKPKMVVPENAMKMEKKDKWRMIFIYGIVFVGISFLAGLMITGLNLNALLATDFLVSNFIAVPLLIQGLLMIPVVILLIWYEKRKYNLKLSDYGLIKDAKPYLKAALYAVLLFLVLYVTLNLAASFTIHNLFIWRIAGFLELFLYLFVGVLVFEIMFRGMIQNKLYKYKDDSSFIPTRWMELFKAALITGIIEGLALGIMITMMLAAGGFDVFAADYGGMIPPHMGISLSWLPPMFILLPVAMIFVEMGLGFLRAGLFREFNRNFIASSLFAALTLAWLLSVLLPAINPYTPRFVFMT